MAGCFLRDAHVQYFAKMLQGLPSEYQSQECNRITFAYFAVSALDILGALDQAALAQSGKHGNCIELSLEAAAFFKRTHYCQEDQIHQSLDFWVAAAEIVDWVYSLQVLPDADKDELFQNGPAFGFRGSTSICMGFSPAGCGPSVHDGGHLAMTYSALAILRILGDDYSRVSRNAILMSMRLLQQPDGSFSPIHLGAETDMRFVFCAAAICAMLDDWRGMDVQLAYEYIIRSQSYDDGFGLAPGLESHGGATYCAVAALKLMGKLISDRSSLGPATQAINFEVLIDWLSQRQAENGGFQGRINKDADTCYAFWVGACLQILGVYNFSSKEALRRFLLTCQKEDGGFSKYPGQWVDALHSYYGVCGFSLLNEPGLNGLCSELGMTARAANGIGLKL